MKKYNFGYPCQNCHKAKVKRRVLQDYNFHEVLIKKAVLGECPRCGSRSYPAMELKRWLRTKAKPLKPKEL